MINLSILSPLNVAVSWGLLLLIWLVQIIIYPSFSRIPDSEFIEYHRWYVVRIGAMVGPLMILEVLGVIGWMILEGRTLITTISAFLVVIVWLSTFILQVPIHKHLQEGKDVPAIRRLVATNWIRTIAWSLRAAVVTFSALTV